MLVFREQLRPVVIRQNRLSCSRYITKVLSRTAHNAMNVCRKRIHLNVQNEFIDCGDMNDIRLIQDDFVVIR